MKPEVIDLTADEVDKTFKHYYDIKKGLTIPTLDRKEKAKLKDLESYQVLKHPTKYKYFIPIFDLDDDSYQIDLMFIPELKKQNHGYDIIFTAIEITTRMAYAIPMKKKDEETMSDVMIKFIKLSGCKKLTSDAGSEFKNKTIKEILQKNGVKHKIYKSNDNQKRGLSLIERFNRTLRGYIVKYIQVSGQLNYVDALQDLVYNYNHTYNTSIHGSPFDVYRSPQKKFYIRNERVKQAMDNIKKDQRNFKIGDYVRVLQPVEQFGKETTYFSKEIYRIRTKNAFTYTLEDEQGKLHPFKYRPFQLQKVNKVIIPRENSDIDKHYKQARREHKIDRKLRQEDLLPAIEGKRERKEKKIFDPSTEVNRKYV